MGQEYPNPLGTGMGFNFSSPLGMSRVTDKYMRLGMGTGTGMTKPVPTPPHCHAYLTPTVVSTNLVINVVCNIYMHKEEMKQNTLSKHHSTSSTPIIQQLSLIIQ